MVEVEDHATGLKLGMNKTSCQSRVARTVESGQAGHDTPTSLRTIVFPLSLCLWKVKAWERKRANVAYS
jgi:hypothetical protein